LQETKKKEAEEEILKEEIEENKRERLDWLFRR